MMGHTSMKMILERYYSYIKNYRSEEGSEFMENAYEPIMESAEQVPTSGKSGDLASNWPQNKNGELVATTNSPILFKKFAL